MLTSLSYGKEDPPTTNPVNPIGLNKLDGMLSGKDFQGLVVIMASWCPPCREELPILEKLFQKYKDKGLRIVALSVDKDGPKAVQPLINNLKISFPVYWGGMKAVKHYRISGIPTTMLYQQGRLVGKLPGSHSKRTFEKKIKALLPNQ